MPNYNPTNINTINIILTKQVIFRNICIMYIYIYIFVCRYMYIYTYIYTIIINNKRNHKFERNQGGIYGLKERKT